MKKKKNTYILLAVVLLVWGMVVYRFFSYTDPGVPQTVVSPQVSLDPLEAEKREIVTIDVNYRDPFLGKMYSTKDLSKVSKKKHIVAEPVEWPQLIYKGIVSDNREKKKVFMLIINGKTYMMKEKDIQDGILIKSGNRHSITVKYKGDLTTIMIKE